MSSRNRSVVCNVVCRAAFTEPSPQPYEFTSYFLALFLEDQFEYYVLVKRTGLSSRFHQQDNRYELRSVQYRTGPHRECIWRLIKRKWIWWSDIAKSTCDSMRGLAFCQGHVCHSTLDPRRLSPLQHRGPVCVSDASNAVLWKYRERCASCDWWSSLVNWLGTA